MPVLRACVCPHVVSVLISPCASPHQLAGSFAWRMRTLGRCQRCSSFQRARPFSSTSPRLSTTVPVLLPSASLPSPRLLITKWVTGRSAGAGGEMIASEMRTTATPSMLWCQWLRLNLQMCQIPKVALVFAACRVWCHAAHVAHSDVALGSARPRVSVCH
jgi:hypothetical protein